MGVAKGFAPLVATVAVWCGFGGLLLARAAGAAVPPGAVAIAALLALAVALGLAGRAVVRIFRGPPLVGFPTDQAVLCEPAEAVVVRAAAQLRGTLGGAGHVHRARLVLPAIAWGAAAALAEGVIASGGEAPLWPLVILVPAAASSWKWRPLPFHYREAMGGWLVVHPRAVRDWLVRDLPGAQRSLRGVMLTFGSPGHDGWVNSPSGTRAGGEPPRDEADAGS